VLFASVVFSMACLKNFFSVSVDDADASFKKPLEKAPRWVVTYIKALLAINTLCFLARAPVLACVVQTWHQCACRKPLHLWLLGDLAFAATQVPLRAGMLLHLPHVLDTDGVQSALGVLSSKASKCSQYLQTAHYVWLLLGAVWAVQVDCSCAVASWVKIVVQVNVGRAVVTLIGYYGGLLRPNVKTVIYDDKKASLHHGHTSCAVCLADFAENQSLRQLPCSHVFCASCADKWLQVRRCCPTCMRAV